MARGEVGWAARGRAARSRHGFFIRQPRTAFLRCVAFLSPERARSLSWCGRTFMTLRLESARTHARVLLLAHGCLTLLCAASFPHPPLQTARLLVAGRARASARWRSEPPASCLIAALRAAQRCERATPGVLASPALAGPCIRFAGKITTRTHTPAGSSKMCVSCMTHQLEQPVPRASFKSTACHCVASRHTHDGGGLSPVSSHLVLRAHHQKNSPYLKLR